MPLMSQVLYHGFMSKEADIFSFGVILWVRNTYLKSWLCVAMIKFCPAWKLDPLLQLKHLQQCALDKILAQQIGTCTEEVQPWASGVCHPPCHSALKW